MSVLLLLAACASPEPELPGSWSDAVFDRVRIHSQGDVNFQHATGTFDLRDGPYASATLVVDLDTDCYPWDLWQDNPPPAGQNWPASCDAFDRNFEWVVDPAVDAADPPGFEVVRAITPFGGPMHLDIDVTDLANALTQGEHTLHVRLPTWSDGAGQVSGSNGGWWVTASVEATPGEPPRDVLAAVPLLYLDHGSGTEPVPVAFDVPPGTTSGRLEYRVTGHGGGSGQPIVCRGPAEEFCRRDHHVFVDDVEIDTFVPWRNDCAQLCTIADDAGFDYCLENPCGAISSVRASRANWCPGDVTPPVVWEAQAPATEGSHTFDYAIDDVVAGGSWRVSATYFAYGSR